METKTEKQCQSSDNNYKPHLFSERELEYHLHHIKFIMF